MRLVYNELHKRYEFRVDTREERDENNGNRLGLAIATTAKFQVVAWDARGNEKVPVYGTKDPYKAQTLGQYAAPAVRDQIRAHVTERGGAVPVLTFVDGIYIWSGPIEGNGIMYREIPKAAEFVFTRFPARDIPRGAGRDFDDPVWWTNSSRKAAKCADYADEAARLAIGTAMAKHHRALEASRAENSDLEIPVPDGLEPFPYQRAGVAYASVRKRVLFGDEMGLGKTIQAILWINLVPEIRRVLVVCPASLKRNWMKEMAGDVDTGKQGWLTRPTTVGIADSSYSKVVPETDIVIINYELLYRRINTGKLRKDKKTKKEKIVYEHVLRESLKGKWDLLIVDECHRLKGDPKDVIQSRMAFSLEAERIAFLSGTPLVNRPRELWNLVHHLAPNVFTDKADFMERYCKGGGYMDPYAGASNLPELQEKLRVWFMVRRLKRDVLKDLPPKLRQVIELPADGCEKVVKNERLAFESKENAMTALRLRVELAKASDDPDEYKAAVSKLVKGIKVAFEQLSIMRRDTAIAKIPIVTEHIAGILAEGHKVILFAHHKEVVHKIAESFPKETVTFDGDTSLKNREQAIIDFQTKDQIRLFIGTMGAAGVGITLTASSYVVFAELDWVPLRVVQAEDRAHRIGQLESVLIQHLVLEGSLDQRMARVLVDKQDVADRLLDRESADELLAEPVIPDREKMATQGVSRKDVANLAEKLTPEAIAAVHMGLRLLAGTHKDSALLEGQTFRTVDAPLGKLIAEAKTLTPKLAALGMKFLGKYRNTQLAVIPEIQQLFSGDLI